MLAKQAYFASWAAAAARAHPTGGFAVPRAAAVPRQRMVGAVSLPAGRVDAARARRALSCATANRSASISRGRTVSSNPVQQVKTAGFSFRETEACSLAGDDAIRPCPKNARPDSSAVRRADLVVTATAPAIPRTRNAQRVITVLLSTRIEASGPASPTCAEQRIARAESTFVQNVLAKTYSPTACARRRGRGSSPRSRAPRRRRHAETRARGVPANPYGLVPTARQRSPEPGAEPADEGRGVANPPERTSPRSNTPGPLAPRQREGHGRRVPARRATTVQDTTRTSALRSCRLVRRKCPYRVAPTGRPPRRCIRSPRETPACAT